VGRSQSQACPSHVERIAGIGGFFPGQRETSGEGFFQIFLGFVELPEVAEDLADGVLAGGQVGAVAAVARLVIGQFGLGRLGLLLGL
jgi:hypothetical protein